MKIKPCKSEYRLILILLITICATQSAAGRACAKEMSISIADFENGSLPFVLCMKDE